MNDTESEKFIIKFLFLVHLTRYPVYTSISIRMKDIPFENSITFEVLHEYEQKNKRVRISFIIKISQILFSTEKFFFIRWQILWKLDIIIVNTFQKRSKYSWFFVTAFFFSSLTST